MAVPLFLDLALEDSTTLGTAAFVLKGTVQNRRLFAAAAPSGGQAFYFADDGSGSALFSVSSSPMNWNGHGFVFTDDLPLFKADINMLDLPAASDLIVLTADQFFDAVGTSAMAR